MTEVDPVARRSYEERISHNDPGPGAGVGGKARRRARGRLKAAHKGSALLNSPDLLPASIEISLGEGDSLRSPNP